MDYKQYQKYRKEILNTHTNYIDLGELNLYKTYNTTIPERTQGHIGNNVHRCHIVDDFIREYNLNENNKKEIGITEGVRHSINILMKHYNQKTWLIPENQYPYYQQAAQKNKINTNTYTINHDEKKITQQIEQDNESQILLICAPNKPYNNQKPYETIKQWINKDKDNIAIIDTVYLFNLETEKTLWELYKTGQIIILYSLSKAYSTPKKCGFTITKNNTIQQTIKNLPKNDNALSETYVLLNNQQKTKQNIQKSLNNKNKKLQQIFQTNTTLKTYEKIIKNNQNTKNPTYLFFIPNITHQEMLKQNIITIPNTVYNIKEPGTIISTLNIK